MTMKPRGTNIMTSVSFMVGRMFDKERLEAPNLETARHTVARKIGVPPGTIQNIQRDRLKFVDRIEAKVRAAFMRMLDQEISKATHELEIARRASDRMDTAAIFAADAAVQNARKMIEGLK